MQRTSPVHYIDPSVISIIPNANNSVSDLAVHITNNAKIKVYSNGIQQLSYNAKGNFQEWTIAGLNRRLTADINSVAKVPYTIYARLLRDDKTKGYLIFTPQRQQGNEWIDKYPYVTNDGLSKTYYGTPSNKYWYIRLGEVTVPVDGKRTVELDTGILGTDLYNSEWNTDPDQMPLRIDIACTIDNEDAGPKPYVPWGKTLVLTAGLLEGWAKTDVARFDHWTITRNSGLSDADLIWNASHAAAFSNTGTVVLTHARGRGDDFGGSVSTLFTIAAWEKNDAYDPEDDLSEETEFLQMTQASVNIMAETVEKFELSLSTNIVGYNPQTEMYNPGSGVDIRIRATDQRSDVFDLTGAQFTNAQLQVSWATVDSDTWTNVSFEGTPTAVAVGNISVDAFAAQKSIVVRLTRQIGTVEHPDTMELTRATVAYVRDGEDSRDREWIFIRTLLPDNYGTLPSLINVGEVNPEGHAAGGSTPYDATLDEWVPQGWWDEQQGVDEVHLYEYGSYRDYIRDDEGEGGQWGQFTRPRIWGHWGDDAVTYDIVPDVSVINADSKGNVTSDGIVVRAYRTKGTERSSNILPDPDIPEQGDYYMAEYSIDGKPWTACAKFLHLEETSGGEKIIVYRYGVESSVVKTSKKTVSFRLKHTKDTTVTLKETTPIKVLRIITEEEAEELIEQYGKKLFLSKIDDDIAEGLITLLKGIQVGAYDIPDILGQGGVFSIDPQTGKVSLVTDYLYARVKAYFDSVVIREYQHESGNRIKSPAQGFNASRIEYIKIANSQETIVENASDADFFRCYWRVDDGETKTDNQFIIGDLAFCEHSGIVGGTLTTKRYWRVVIGRNSGNTTTANGEAWIDLSNAHGANNAPVMTTITYEGQGGSTLTKSVLSFENASNDVPEAHDDICMLGCVVDTTRQGAIVEYVSGTDSPSYQIFQGIGSDATNPYSLDGKNQISLGYRTTGTGAGRAYMNVYGDMYIGAKPNGQGVSPTYIKYDSGQQRIDIKANVIFQNPTTQQETTLDNFASVVASDLSDLQDQIDGAIETYFLEGTPSLLVPPVVNPQGGDYPNPWLDGTETAAEREKILSRHLGDMYYDIADPDDSLTSGFAYRFIKDANNNFVWQYIDDTAITAALAKAAQALNVANTKAKVFKTLSGVLPPAPYSVNDIWVNATGTWGSGASAVTWDNEILKCITACPSGDTPSISHWDKASKYTDDTRVEYYMNILTNGMLNPQTDKEIALATQHAIQTALGGATIIDGGLMLTSLIYLRKLNNAGDDPTNPANYTTYAGISGVYDSNLYGGGIAAWYGGSNIDKRNATTGEYDVTNGAKTGFRFDGSGWLANGNIYWNEAGAVTIKNITTLSDSQNTNLLNELATFNNAFHFTTTGQGSTTVLSITPQVPFTSLEILDTTVNPSVGRPVATQKWVNDNYISVAFFNRLFQTYNGSTLVNANDTTTTIDSIKAMFGFWTQQYISALGQNSGSGGGGGGATRLDALSDVAISNPTNGQVLKYNSTTGKWYNGTDSGVSSVAWGDITGKPSTIAGYNIGDAYISSGTVYLGGSSITPVTSLSGYATETWVGNNYLALTGGTLTGKLTVKSPIFGYNYNVAGNNAAAFIFDKSGSNYTGIGSHTTSDTIWFGACDSDGTWVDTYKQIWDFNGTIKQEGNAVIHAGNISSQSVSSATSATQLQTSRSLWGNSFNGTADINGTITITGSGWKSIEITRTNLGNSSVGGVDGSGAYFGHTKDGVTDYFYLKAGSGLSASCNVNVYNKHLFVEGSSTGSSTISSDLDSIIISPKQTRTITTGTYYSGIAFNHLYRHSSNSYTDTAHAWIGTRMLSHTGGEQAALVFATKEGTDNTDRPVERMCITPTGNVGIGMASPYYKLEVADGTAAISKNLASTSWVSDSGQIICIAKNTYYRIGLAATTNGYAVIQGGNSGTGAIPLLLNPNAGNVGIGTTTVSYKLHVAGDILATQGVIGGGSSGVIVGGKYDGTYTGAYDNIERLGNGGKLYIQYYNSGDLNICQGGGKVGIGVTSPDCRLHVADRMKVVGGSNGNTNDKWIFKVVQGTDNGSGAYDTVIFSSNDVCSLRISESDNTQIGLCGGDHHGTLTSTHDFRFYTGCTVNAQIYSGASGTLGMLIDSSGNVGIGTSSPSYKLHVAGDIYATGGVSCLSDERFKTIKGDTTLTVDQIAKMPSIKYTKKDGKDDKVHVGSIAQRWMEVLPEVVLKANDEVGTLSINYGVAAIIASITTARKVVEHERRIKELEKENARLRTEIQQLTMKGT